VNARELDEVAPHGVTTASEGTRTDDRLLYRIPEVVGRLNVSRSEVYELLTSGAVRSVQIDRTRLVRGCDLQAYVDALESSLLDRWSTTRPRSSSLRSRSPTSARR
jgi:hypothetical protein